MSKDIEYLKKRLESLKQEEENARVNFYMIKGAIKDVEGLIEEYESPNKENDEGGNKKKKTSSSGKNK